MSLKDAGPDEHNEYHHAAKNLEPRVAKLETGLEILTRDVSSLAVVVREQGRNVESEIQKLVVAVTQAGAPRKTEWPTLIATMMLILAIGSTAFLPLNKTSAENKIDIHEVRTLLDSHVSKDSHPVTAEILKQMGVRLNKLESNEDERNKADLDELRGIKKAVIGFHMGPLTGEKGK